MPEYLKDIGTEADVDESSPKMILRYEPPYFRIPFRNVFRGKKEYDLRERIEQSFYKFPINMVPVKGLVVIAAGKDNHFVVGTFRGKSGKRIPVIGGIERDHQ